MTGPIVVDRARWLGHRWREHGLGGRCGDDALDRMLTLGFQDTRQVGAVQAPAQRTTKVDGAGVADAVSADGPLVALWPARVAPHAYRPGRLDFVRDALAPRDADEGGPAHVEAAEEVAAALGAVVRAPLPKGEASGEVTGGCGRLRWSGARGCEARHVPGRLFREAGRQARLCSTRTGGRAPSSLRHRTTRGRSRTVRAWRC